MHSSNIIVGSVGKCFLLALALFVGLMAFSSPHSRAHGTNGQMCSVGSFAMTCFGDVLNLNAAQLAFS